MSYRLEILNGSSYGPSRHKGHPCKEKLPWNPCKKIPWTIELAINQPFVELDNHNFAWKTSFVQSSKFGQYRMIMASCNLLRSFGYPPPFFLIDSRILEWPLMAPTLCKIYTYPPPNDRFRSISEAGIELFSQQNNFCL